MGFVRPELLLLLLPALWIWWSTRAASRTTQAIRLLAIVLVVGAIAAPYLRTSTAGRDLVIVVDRSLSMPTDSGDTARELIALAEDAREAGDRTAIVSFGGGAVLESLPHETQNFSSFTRPLDPDSSDLGEALDAALNLIPDERQGSILVISDGEENGRDPVDAARRAFARGIRVDVRPVARPAVADVSVERLDLPSQVSLAEPFQFSVWVHSDTALDAEFVLTRNGLELSRGMRSFTAGMNRLLFRDILTDGGMATYQVQLAHPNDRIAENNHGLGAVQATGTKPLLVLNHDGNEDTLVRALRKAELPVEVRSPESLRLTPLGLLRWRGVVLENVSAARIGSRGLDALADYVTERGGGLLMTGGKGSFGVGGYHLTAIDELLPVSMELRQEHRKQGVALVIVLDRSGSMGASAGTGMTKMDLANLGSVAAIELLSEIDAVGVIAVDSSDHTIQPLTQVSDVDALTSKVRTIESMGGGIFVYTGMLAAGKMLDPAPHTNRHIILFADAADAEEQERVPELVERLVEMGTSVSVIALGTEFDSDANFLKDVAKRGGGEAYFTMQATELPKLFAQDTMMVARSTFIEEDTEVQARPDLFGLGEVSADGFPVLEGYNLNYLRENAIAGIVTQDEYQAPILAFHQAGLGRSAAFCAQIGGTFGGRITSWDGFASFFVTLARWLVGQEEPQELFASVRRDGANAVVSVEVDPDAPVPPDTSNLSVRMRRPNGEYTEHLLERTDENRYETRIDLNGAGVAIGTIRLADGRFHNLPPIVLPYSPEFERATDPLAGERALRKLAADTGGEVAPPAHTLLRGPREAHAFRVISRELVLAALLALLIEIAGRRLGLWQSFAAVLQRAKRQRAAGDEAPDTTAGASRGAQQARRASKAAEPEAALDPLRAPSKRQAGSVGNALDQARRAAGRKLDR